ncbi:hypothetical protein MYX82_10800, partial [Acidobacteria bacterium AH-259-D05]|nr:hypothetical protein [Acidobacteria bacterium AH-259-D05]
FLEAKQISYVIIGGLAVQHWGEPRATPDVYVTVLVPADQEKQFLSLVLEHFEPRIPEAETFARESRVLLLSASNGRPIDLSLGIPGYEEEVMARAVTVDWLGQRPLHLISAEDLIIHKCVAGRARDIEDVKTILWRQAGKVEMEYIRKWLGEFSRSTQEDSLECFEQALRESEPQDS